LRECITTERKKQDSEVLAEDIRNREQKQRDEVINPKGKQLKDEQKSYHSSTLRKQIDIRIGQSAQIRENWLKREKEFLLIRSSQRRHAQSVDNATEQREEDVLRFTTEAQRLCRHLRGTERLACIDARVNELLEALP